MWHTDTHADNTSIYIKNFYPFVNTQLFISFRAILEVYGRGGVHLLGPRYELKKVAQTPSISMDLGFHELRESCEQAGTAGV